MATKSTAVVLAILAILTVFTIPSGVAGPQQQIAFAQGVEEDSEGGEEITFDDVKVVDGEEVIEVGAEGGGGEEGEETGSDDAFSLQSILEFLAQFDLDDEGSDGDDAGVGGGGEDGDNNGGEVEVQQTDTNVEQQDSDTTQTRSQSQTETSVIVDRDVQGGGQVGQDPPTGTPGGPGVVGPPGCLTCA
jgi:hypothetical protein